MSNIEIENVDLGNVILADAVFRDFPITFAGADTFAAGTIMKVVAGKLVPFEIADAATIPLTVLTYDVTATGAGDIPGRAMVSGQVRKELLIVDLVGDDSTITQATLDHLRGFGLVAQNVQNLSDLDNQ